MKLLKQTLLTAALFLLTTAQSNAQPFENAGQYMDFVSKANADLTAKYLFYLSAVAHGKSARKVEKRRIEVVGAISDTRYSIMGMGPWKGDKTLKDTSVAYLKILYNVFNEDYGKIVNMEEIAEQSYDGMEAYLLAQQKAQEKLEQASEKQREMQRKFAAKNNVNLIDNESELESKSKIVNEVMDHCNQMYLTFFKPYKQEMYLMDAVEKKNVASIEQNINSLKKFSELGLEKLNDAKGYSNDPALIEACKKALEFYKAEAANGAVMTDYILKEESFAKLKKQFDSKPASKRTQQDVDDFNKAVNDINASLKVFNDTNAGLNKQRTSMLNDWNKTYSKYMDNYMPKQQRQ
jgi:hypothetical protein